MNNENAHARTIYMAYVARADARVYEDAAVAAENAAANAADLLDAADAAKEAYDQAEADYIRAAFQARVAAKVAALAADRVAAHKLAC